MYSNIILGFGIGWCLAYMLCIIYLVKKAELGKTGGDTGEGKVAEGLNLLMTNISDIKKQYGDTRFDQLKNLANAFSRNPKAFNYDYQSLVKEPESKLKNIDSQIDDILKKCDTVISSVEKSKLSQQTSTGQDQGKVKDKKFVTVNIIGIVGIVIANLLYFVIKI
jgi:hypothetical protein